MDKKIKMLVIPSDHYGVGKWRSVSPHVYIAEHYGDEFDIDIVYDLPKEGLDKFLSQYDLIHFHKMLDKNCQILDMIKFLGIPVIMDIDDHYKLGDYHPASVTAKREKWHLPIIEHIKKADYVTTTTPIFANVIKKNNKNVKVFPNAVDTSEKQFEPTKNDSNGMLRVGIICGSSHLHDIKLLGPLCEMTAPNVQIVLCGRGQCISGSHRIIGIGREQLDIIAYGIHGGVDISQRDIYQIMELVYGIGKALKIIQSKMRLHLPDDTAYILAPVYLAVIVAEGYKTRLPSDYASDIIAGVLIACGGMILALINGSLGISGYTACIHTVIGSHCRIGSIMEWI